MELIQHPEEIWCKYSLQENEPWKKAAVLKPGAFKHQKKNTYHERIQVSGAKWKDLSKLSRFLQKRSHRLFYKYLRMQEVRQKRLIKN